MTATDEGRHRMNRLTRIVIVITLVLAGGLALSSTHRAAANSKVESVLSIDHDHDSGKIGRRCVFDSDFDFGRRIAFCSAKRYINVTTCQDTGICYQAKSNTGYYFNNYVVCYVGTASRPCKGVAFVHNGEFDGARPSSRRLSCGSWEDTSDAEHGATCGDPAGGAIYDLHHTTTVAEGSSGTWPGWYSTMYYVHIQLDDGQRYDPPLNESISNQVFDLYGAPGNP